MFWSRAHSVRIGLVVAVGLSCLAVAPPAFSARRGHADRSRDGVARQEKDASRERQSRPAAKERQQPEKARSAQPTAERGRSRVVRAAPPARSRSTETGKHSVSPRAWWRPQQPAAPASSKPEARVYQTPMSRPRTSEPRTYRPSPVSEKTGRQRGPADRPSVYRVYRDPENRTTPRTTPQAPERALHSQPATPLSRPSGDDERRLRPAPERGRADGGRAGFTPPRSEERKFTVPRAEFRGPDAERDVKVVPRESRERARNRFQTWVRERNRDGARPEPRRPRRDAVGNAVPADVELIRRDSISRISINYHRIERQFGAPSYRYMIRPRSRADYWDGYRDGYADGYWAGRHYVGHSPVVVSFYYPYYWSDPYWLAFGYHGYYPAVYHYWGWCPGWVYPARVYHVPVEYVYVPATPYRYYYQGYGVDYAGAQRTIDEVRRGWFAGEITPIAAHLTDRLDVRVYFDGKYEYTTSTEDYYAMTVDAMATTQTVAMDFDDPIWISSHEIFYTGRHVFCDPDGERHRVYVSYRLRRLGTEWYIVAVGSSLEPIRHQYRDFRYS